MGALLRGHGLLVGDGGGLMYRVFVFTKCGLVTKVVESIDADYVLHIAEEVGSNDIHINQDLSNRTTSVDVYSQEDCENCR